MVDATRYIQKIIADNTIKEDDHNNLREIISKFPYFQSARVLYLKSLKNKESYKYNNELKIVAAHTADRKILFDLITSKKFQKEHYEKDKNDNQKKTISLKSLTSQKKENIEKTVKELSIGKPIKFTKNEAFSFNQWLELSSKKTITRDSNIQQIIEESQQNSIIDKFIENNPKISRPSKINNPSLKTVEVKEDNQLMTETLAKVYLEQKKYESAIKAYKILILKYPEKSGFFADQIKKIKILQNHK